MDRPPSYLSETDPTADRRRRRVAAIALLAAFGVVALVVAVAASAYRRCGEPPAADGRTVAVVIQQGATGQDVVQQLARPGSDPLWRFRRQPAAAGHRTGAAILAGSYDVPVGASLDDILALMTTPPQRCPDGSADDP